MYLGIREAHVFYKIMKKKMMLYNDIKISKVQKVIYSSLDLMNKPVRQLLFTKLCNSLNQIEFTI